MPKPVHIIALNVALAQIVDAQAKIEAAQKNIRDVLVDLEFQHPVSASLNSAALATTIAKVHLDELCKRFPR